MEKWRGSRVHTPWLQWIDKGGGACSSITTATSIELVIIECVILLPGVGTRTPTQQKKTGRAGHTRSHHQQPLFWSSRSQCHQLQRSKS